MREITNEEIQKQPEKKCLCTAFGVLNVEGGCPRHSQPEKKWCGHYSDCGVHNEPAESKGACTCSQPPVSEWESKFDTLVKGLEVYRGEDKTAYFEMADMKEIKAFISSQIEKVKAEEEEKWRKILNMAINIINCFKI